MSLAFLHARGGRRTALAAAAATGLTGALLGLAPSSVAQADDLSSPTPTSMAVGWLASRLNSDNLLGTTESPNVTSTIDFGIGLARTDADTATLTRVINGVDGVLSTYIGAEGDATRSAQTAKAAAFYAAAADPRNAAGIDLIARVEAVVGDDGGLVTTYGADYFNQSSAVSALDAADSDETNAATEYLLAGQCDDGGWGFLDSWSNPGSTECVSDPDTTSVAITSLIPQNDDTDVADAIDQATTYLLGQQAGDGSFGLTEYTPYNVNSTGLAAVALSEAGATDAASKAAVWVRAHQATGTECDGMLRDDKGAIAYSDQSLIDGVDFGIGETEAEWLTADAQAISALALAPAATGDLDVESPSYFIKAGSDVKLKVKGLAPGERGCASIGGNRVSVVSTDGTATATVQAPAREKTATAAVAATDQAAGMPVMVLKAKKKLALDFAKKVKKGKKQKVVVKKLAAGEPVKVVVGSKSVKGKANAKGKFVAKVKVIKKGKTKVAVRGKYAGRKAAGTFKVA